MKFISNTYRTYRTHRRAALPLIALLLLAALFGGCKPESGDPAVSPGAQASPAPSQAVKPSGTGFPSGSPAPSEAPDAVSQPPSPIPTPYIDRSKNYIFFEGALLGSYEDGKWYSNMPSFYDFEVDTKAYSIGDILCRDDLNAYSDSAFLGTPGEVTLSFSGGGAVLSDPAKNLALKALSAPVSSDRGLFLLPTFLGGELYGLEISPFGAEWDFGYSNKDRVALTAAHNPLPKSSASLSAPSAKDASAVLSELEKLGIPGAPVDIRYVYELDFDGDGTAERLIIAQNSPVDGEVALSAREVLVGDSGTYVMALLNNGTGYSVLFSHGIPYYLDIDLYSEELTDERLEELRTSLSASDIFSELSYGGVYELNGDGSYEIRLSLKVSEGVSNHFASRGKDGGWSIVMTTFS
ncbi:MAG: hypothetical protein LBL09_00960 [Oscillospiraceae bacterium]|jgi:hypothetical protein|nr:hypothetical protein [Oscillospiraceae bacterium]